MPDCDREDSPETAALFENYSQRRVLKATYEEKKDRFAKEAEALQEEKDRIAQELRKVDTKYNALQAKLAQLSAGYEADKTGLSHSLRRMVSKRSSMKVNLTLTTTSLAILPSLQVRHPYRILYQRRMTHRLKMCRWHHANSTCRSPAW